VSAAREHQAKPRGGGSKPARARILVVDDDPIVADSLAEFLVEEGYSAVTAAGGAEALQALADASSGPVSQRIGLVLCDVSMPGMDGHELLRRLGEAHPDIVAIMLTGYGTIESAVEAVKLGAADYLTKPIIDNELRMSLERALRQQALLVENQSLRRQLESRFGLENVVGSDPKMLRIFDLVEAVASSRTTVLMTGESGSGKSMIARAIHQRSPRADKPFVEIACGSIPETILESELFGHAKGAFTGAHADKQGKFLAAEGGSIFLDEINSASPAMQLKLLRALQERRFEPVGSTETVEVDVRVILATNEPLEPLVEEGKFREDLYYRVNVVRIDVPPLRERPSDIPLLIEHFLRRHCAEIGRQITGCSDAAADALRRYVYPGNVRELGNIIERAVVLARGQTLDVDDLPPDVVRNEPRLGTPGAPSPGAGGADDPETPWTPTPLHDALAEPEKRIILKALRANDWNRQKTADDLGVNRTTLYKKMKQHGLDRLAG